MCVNSNLDATALCCGVSRSLLEELRDSLRCHGLVVWSVTLAARRKPRNALRCHGLVLWSVTLAARRKPRNPSYDFCSGEREPPRRKAVASANPSYDFCSGEREPPRRKAVASAKPSDVFCSDERAEFNGAVMKFLTAH